MLNRSNFHVLFDNDSNWSFEFNLKMMNTMVCSSRGSSFNEFRKQREDAAVVANGFNPTGLNSMVQQYGSTVWFNIMVQTHRAKQGEDRL